MNHFSIVLGHTRAIYQRKLLEVLTNETSEGKLNYFSFLEKDFIFILKDKRMKSSRMDQYQQHHHVLLIVIQSLGKSKLFEH
jgi:hypothetical protein